jgi:hypothetical protein
MPGENAQRLSALTHHFEFALEAGTQGPFDPWLKVIKAMNASRDADFAIIPQKALNFAVAWAKAMQTFLDEGKNLPDIIDKSCEFAMLQVADVTIADTKYAQALLIQYWQYGENLAEHLRQTQPALYEFIVSSFPPVSTEKGTLPVIEEEELSVLTDQLISVEPPVPVIKKKKVFRKQQPASPAPSAAEETDVQGWVYDLSQVMIGGGPVDWNQVPKIDKATGQPWFPPSPNATL